MSNDIKRLQELAGIKEADIVNIGDKRAEKRHTAVEKRHLDTVAGRVRLLNDNVQELEMFLNVGRRSHNVQLPEVEQKLNEMKQLIKELNSIVTKKLYSKRG